MATVATTTIADGLAAPGTGPVTLRYINASTTYFYTVIRTATDTLSVYVSTNSGSSWSLSTSFTHVGLQEWSTVVTESSYLHIAYRIGTGTADTVYYRRFNFTTSTWSSALAVSGSDANAGSIGSRWQGVDLVVKRNSDNSYAIMVVGHYADTTPRYGVYAMGVSINKAGTIYSNNGIITGNRSWFLAGTNPGRSGVAAETEHNGDGYSTDVPNVWITWGRTVVRAVKVAWVSSSVGWQGPSSAITVRSSLPTSNDYAAGRWDGTQWLMAVPSPDDTTMVRLYQRNKANTVQTSFDTPTHPQGVVKYCALSYDNVSKNPRVYAVGTSAATLYYVDYSRATAVWSSWALVSASTIANSGAEFGVARGGTAADARHDVAYSVSGSPNTVTYTSQTSSAAPATAQFVTAGQAYSNGGAANVTATLPLAWSFTDIDPGSSQGSYALSRQIGAGAVAYWNATSSTWGASEVQNTSATQGLTLATAWGVDGDSPHQYKVKVWDNTGTVSPGYSNPLTLYPSAPVNPAITAPAAAAVINSDTLTVTWTAAEQTGARLVLNQTSPNAITVTDTGAMAGYTSLTYTLPSVLVNGYAYTITLYTYNNDGLISAGQTRAFTVSYAPPPAMYSTYTPSPVFGYITVAGASLTPVGVQPSIISADLYRRPNLTPALNTNPTFAGNTTGYTASTVSASGGTLTYSTTQFAPASSPGAARLVPNGTGTAPSVESTPVVVGAVSVLYGSAWIRPDTANKPIYVQINWYTSAGAYLSSVAVTVASPVAAAWQYVEVYADPTVVGNVGKASVAAGVSGTPAGTDAVYADELRLRLYDPTTPTRLVTGAVPPAVYNDWGTAAGVDYEYRWTARGATGATAPGPWMS